MTSDWRIANAPLAKLSCTRCGLLYREPGLPMPADFGGGYDLYAHPAGTPAERKRQAAYASWIAASVQPPHRVLDVGCGNGSLLLALSELWPHAVMWGCDPSPESVRHAAAAGLEVWTGTAETLSPKRKADVVISVNVLEHTSDPHAFVASLCNALAPNGQVLLICPDGRRPSVELLVVDHLYSFTATHLRTLLEEAELAITRWSVAPHSLGPFQMVVARRGSESALTADQSDIGRLRQVQHHFLEAWSRLDAALVLRLPDDVVCFGTGEAAGLLRAYAPTSWSHVRACTTDDAVAGTFGGVPTVPIGDITAEAVILVAVRPQDQATVAARLRSRFARVVTWYDLVPSDGP